MTDRTPTHSSRSPRIVSSGAVESALREQALQARHTPSSRLRQRTLSALRELPSPDTSENPIHRHRAFAAVALCACALIASIVAFTLPQQSGPAEPVLVKGAEPVSVPSISQDRPVRSILPSTTLAHQVSMKNPLMIEARLLARDSRQTITTFQAGLPRMPRVENSRTAPTKTTPAVRP